MRWAFCARCPIGDACLSWALTTNQEHGVFGGLNEAERQRARRRIRRAAS